MFETWQSRKCFPNTNSNRGAKSAFSRKNDSVRGARALAHSLARSFACSLASLDRHVLPTFRIINRIPCRTHIPGAPRIYMPESRGIEGRGKRERRDPSVSYSRNTKKNTVTLLFWQVRKSPLKYANAAVLRTHFSCTRVYVRCATARTFQELYISFGRACCAHLSEGTCAILWKPLAHCDALRRRRNPTQLLTTAMRLSCNVDEFFSL